MFLIELTQHQTVDKKVEVNVALLFYMFELEWYDVSLDKNVPYTRIVSSNGQSVEVKETKEEVKAVMARAMYEAQRPQPVFR